jgi:small membrane protein
MKPIQFILVLFMLIIAGAYFLRLRKKTYDRLIVIFFIVAGIILVMVPDLSAEIARLVGVGRGVDLVLYLGLLGLSFVCLLLYSKIRELEATLTDLVRLIAIAEASNPNKNSKGEPTFPNLENKENPFPSKSQ